MSSSVGGMSVCAPHRMQNLRLRSTLSARMRGLCWRGDRDRGFSTRTHDGLESRSLSAFGLLPGISSEEAKKSSAVVDQQLGRTLEQRSYGRATCVRRSPNLTLRIVRGPLAPMRRDNIHLGSGTCAFRLISSEAWATPGPFPLGSVGQTPGRHMSRWRCGGI